MNKQQKFIDTRLLNGHYLKTNDMLNDYRFTIIGNPNFFDKYIINSSEYSSQLPYYLIPVLKDTTNVIEYSTFNLEDILNNIDDKIIHHLLCLYEKTINKTTTKKTSIQSLKSFLRLLTDKGKYDQKELNTLNNIESLIKTSTNNESFESSVYYFIKNMPIEDKIFPVEMQIYPELTENPWFFDKNETHTFLEKTFFEQISPELEGYNLEPNPIYFFNGLEGKLVLSFYPHYTFYCKDEKGEFFLHKPNNFVNPKTRSDGLLPFFDRSLIFNPSQTPNFLYKDKQSLHKAIEEEYNYTGYRKKGLEDALSKLK